MPRRSLTCRWIQPAAVLGALTLSACASVGEIPVVRAASALLVAADGAPAGTAVVTADRDRLTLTVAAAGLPAGVHGIHLHAIGRCEAPAFASAGAHLNPAGHQHGRLNPAGSHLGDLPNVAVGRNRSGAITATLAGTRAELERALFDADGTAIVIHASADDYRTDPTGNSGARIACGVLARD